MYLLMKVKKCNLFKNALRAPTLAQAGPATHTGDLNQVLISQLWSSPVLAVMGIWEENEQMGAFRL